MTETLTFQFENVRAAELFKSWMCESGEQQYWEWQTERELDEDGPITGLEFDWWNGSLVIVKCGRFDGAEELPDE